MIWDELTLEEESFEQVIDRRRRKLGGYESLESGLIERDLNHAMDLDGMWNRQTILRAFQEQVQVNQARKGSGRRHRMGLPCVYA